MERRSKRLWTPKSVAAAADQIQRCAQPQNLHPLVIVPYLDGERLHELEARNISGIDLCGNGVAVVPGEWLVFRSGSSNRFRWEGRIKNVYRSTSALVGRALPQTAEAGWLSGTTVHSVPPLLNSIVRL